MLQLQRSQIASLGHFQRKNRGTIEMMASILEVCLEGTKKTHILYRANISSEPLNEYLELLVRSDMLEKAEVYRTTVKGRIYLEHFKGILSLLGRKDRDMM